MELIIQITSLFILAIPVACIAWTVTHEEVFREPREYCIKNSLNRKTILGRKFFYLFTCEYCFSHYVTLLLLLLTQYKLLYEDWRGFVIAFFSIVWMANVYMTLFSILRMNLKSENTEIKLKTKELETITQNEKPPIQL